MNQQSTTLAPRPSYKNHIIVRIADMEISNDPEATLITHSLGSCLGFVLYDPLLKIGGMIHCMLPTIKRAIDQNDSPCRYVDTGVPLLLNELYARGVAKSRALIYVAGCSSRLDSSNTFKIGQHNYTIFRKIIWKNNLLIESEDVGGEASRTITLEIGTGRFLIK